MERQELIEAINKVMDGSVYLSKAANDKILEQLQHYDLAEKTIPLLTHREKEILHLLAEGLTSNEIAARLYPSNYTIDTHRKNMLQKFNVHNTQSLINAVRKLGMLD